MKNDDRDDLREQVMALTQLLERITEIQARQIDREKSVPGSDPAELMIIENDLAAVHGIARKLVELRGSAANPKR